MRVRGRSPDVRKAHEHLLEQGAAPVGVREVVADSWLRSVAAGVDVDASRPPITLKPDSLGEYRAGHPLASIVPLLDDVLGRAAEDCDSVMATADERGQLLWVRGIPADQEPAGQLLAEGPRLLLDRAAQAPRAGRDTDPSWFARGKEAPDGHR